MAHLTMLSVRVPPATKRLLQHMAATRGDRQLMAVARELLELGLRQRLAELAVAADGAKRAPAAAAHRRRARSLTRGTTGVRQKE